MNNSVLTGDCLKILPTLPAASFQCCITSPPYWGLRDYGVDGQFGLEETPEEYIAKMVDVFREVWRVLRDDGTLWINIGDSYVGANNTNAGGNANFGSQPGRENIGDCPKALWNGLPSKNLVGIPWRLAFAMQAYGWYLRSDIIWHKPNPMPESVTDRPTKSHEYIFLLTKSARYFYDAEAIKEEAIYPGDNRGDRTDSRRGTICNSMNGKTGDYRNKRTVWTIATQPYAEAHFATFPEEIPKLCILAGSRFGDTVLDPFAGSGTTGRVAIELGRKAVLIELNPEYVDLINQRVSVTPAMF